MKKCLVYLLCIIVLPIIASCSKEEKEPELVSGETKITNETGISFTNSSGFEADYVVFKLKSGSSEEKEYGQSLKGYNYTELQVGSKTIFQMHAFKEGEEVLFNAYTEDTEGNHKAIESTSVVIIKDKEVLEIVLDKVE